jgi:hypothetical protein
LFPLFIMAVEKNNNSMDNAKDAHKVKHEAVAAV